MTALFITPLSSPSPTETLNIDDLVTRNALHYKKFTNVPFTGEISCLENGSFKKGKKNGLWEKYYKNGQLWVKGNYKDGIKDGLWEFFNKDGSLKKTETYEDGELVK